MDRRILGRIGAAEQKMRASLPALTPQARLELAESRVQDGRATQTDFLVLFPGHRQEMERRLLARARVLRKKHPPHARPRVDEHDLFQICVAIVALPAGDPVPGNWIKRLREIATTRRFESGHANHLWGLANLLVMSMGGLQGGFLRRRLDDELLRQEESGT